jgi:hypothetical protein
MNLALKAYKGHRYPDFCMTVDTHHRISNYYSTNQWAQYSENLLPKNIKYGQIWKIGTKNCLYF